GVYFFGASNLKWALRTWELPADERARVGNYGIGAINHAFELQFLRFLVEQRGLGRKGDSRTTVVVGAFWGNALDFPAESYFAPLWRRHGLYTYDPATGIADAPLGPVARQYRVEKARCAGLIGGNMNRVARAVALGLGQPLDPTERMKDPAEVRAWILAHWGNLGWSDATAGQVRALAELLDYLTARRIGVRIALLPRRAAFDEVPLDPAYREAVTALAAAKNVPLTDLSSLLTEDDYWDINHYNARGLEKTNAALMAIARDELGRDLPGRD
ncbi:MAG TPA: SGNH/GDSL hydrolase family protein, partial [Candidatus Polarisedimenticolia bacterium]|nr:SGNH/GDSL hydrolase family protein [Candidatus Polarisedimenticolia bacterium]